jgi:hypothetical protein
LQFPLIRSAIGAIRQYRRCGRFDASEAIPTGTAGPRLACIAGIYIPELEIALARWPNSANND